MHENEAYEKYKIFAAKIFTKGTCTPNYSRFYVSKSYVPFTCKSPIVIHFVPIFHRRCRSNPNFYVFSYDKTCLKFCASIRFFLAVFMEKFPKKSVIWTMWKYFYRYGIEGLALYVCWDNLTLPEALGNEIIFIFLKTTQGCCQSNWPSKFGQQSPSNRMFCGVCVCGGGGNLLL